MPYKDPNRRREAIREHYYRNKKSYIEKNRLRRIEMRKWLSTLKDSSPCTDCGKSYPYYVMDFDHLYDKKFVISKLINRNNLSALKAEMQKCEIVCSNCHRIRTYDRLKKA